MQTPAFPERKQGFFAKLNTPAEAIEKYLPMVDLVLVMTVEPGVERIEK